MRKLFITTCLLLATLTVVSAQNRPDRRQRTPEQTEQHRAARAELRTHTQEEVKPILRAARAQLDNSISAEDQAAIERLRQALKPERTGERGQRGERGNRQDRRAKHEAFRAAHAAEFAELDALAAKYATELNQLRERLAPQFETWAAERKAIRGANRAERAGNRPDRQEKEAIGARFLLLRP